MITYRIDARNTHAHEFQVHLTLPKPQALQRLSLPVWIPGSYMVREFGRHLSGLRASQGGAPRPITQIDKTTWQIECTGRGALTLSYSVYAFDTSVRAAFLNAQRGFFNGTSVCLRAEGQENQPHRLELRDLPKGWQVATSLQAATVDARGRGIYEAVDYDDLVDHPVELGTFWRGHFTAHAVLHEVVVAGALPDFDGERLLADTKRICEAEIAFWHANKRAPFDRYVFLLNAVDDGYGGLEHRASTALIAARRDLPQQGKTDAPDGYVTLLGLISHEYFHTWNVKRLRPTELSRYDYTQENYTQLLWFFEGFTSYYDDLFLVRTGTIDEGRYLKLVAKTITGVLGTPGRKVQSVAQSSFDAWVKYYRQDENTLNATISYYTKGSLIALALDLTLRSEGRGSLDEVMRALWLRSAGGPINEADIAQALQDVAGRSMAAELKAWVHGTDDLPLAELLEYFGVTWQAQAPTLAQRLGLKVNESALTGVRVSHVLRGSVAEQAGMAVGDELLAVDNWRIRRLDDAHRLLGMNRQNTVLVSRDQRLLTLALGPEGHMDGNLVSNVTLGIAAQAPRMAAAARKAWLTP
jgi:predicted metalloprotease with PDZ domain